MSPRSQDLTHTTLAVLCIGGLIVAALWILRPFLAAMVWAVMIVVATWPLMLSAQRWLGGRRWLAIAVLIVALLLVFVIPFVLAVGSVVANAEQIVAWARSLGTLHLPPPPDWLEKLPYFGDDFAATWRDYADSSMPALAAKLQPYARELLTWFAARVGSFGLIGLQVLLALQKSYANSIKLVYIDPPFNTGKTQRRTQLRTVRDDAGGDRTGFGGQRYRTEQLSARGFADRFDDYLSFLQPRIEHAHRVLTHLRRVERGLDPLLLAVHHHPVHALLGRHPLGGIRLLRRLSTVVRRLREALDQLLQRIRRAIEDQVVGQRALGRGYLGVRRDVRRVDDGRVQPGLHAVVQEDRVEHCPRPWRDAE